MTLVEAVVPTSPEIVWNACTGHIEAQQAQIQRLCYQPLSALRSLASEVVKNHIIAGSVFGRYESTTCPQLLWGYPNMALG